MVALAACSGDDDGSGDDTTAVGDGGDGDGDDGDGTEPDAAACGSLGSPPCEEGFFCDYPDDNCGLADLPGVCKPRPDVCTDIFDPVCACDGTEYSNQCSAAAAGFDVTSADCAGESSLACGGSTCESDSEYCSVFVPGVPDAETNYECAELPDECTAPSCDCFDGPACDCAIDEQGRVTVTCYAP